MKKSHIGQKSTLRKLSNDKILEIKEIFFYCRKYKIKINYDVLYNQYFVKKSTIQNIVYNITYKEINFDSFTPKNIKLSLYDHKICSKCKESKLTSEFTPSKKLICGFESHCKMCNSSYKKRKSKPLKKSKKIANDQILYDIHKMYQFGVRKKEISKLFNISKTTIYKILYGLY